MTTVNLSKKQFRLELDRCLAEQGLDWYKGIANLLGLALLGLLELHKGKLDKLVGEKSK